MLVSLKELMKRASEGGYAVGAFNVSNLESLMAIMEAAEETGHGVILNYAEVHAPFLSMEQAAVIMLDAARNAKRAGVWSTWITDLPWKPASGRSAWDLRL